MNELNRYTRYAEKKRGTENRFYEVEANETEDGRGHWIFRWGRIGQNPRSKEGTTYSFERAKEICDEQFRKKTLKGDYKEANAMEALASAVEELDERNTSGLKPVEIEIPNFHAGKSEKRCQAFAQKFLDKLNIVRKSRYEFEGVGYERQIESVLKSYCAEWKRICRTKAHGHLADNAAAQTAFRMFFTSLSGNAGCYVYGYFEGVGVH